VAVTPRWTNLEIDGEFSAVSGGSSAFTSTENLGFDDDSGVFSPRVDLSWLNMNLAFDHYDTSYRGDGVLDAQIDLGGVTIPAAEAVSSEFDLQSTSARLTGDFIPGSNVDLGIGVGVALLDVQASITSQSTLETASTDESLPVPLVTGRAAVRFGDLALTGDLGWISIGYDDDEVSYMDLDLAARYSFFSAAGRASGGVVLGYRIVDTDGEYDDGSSSVDFDMEFSGLYFGVSVSL
jgi:hypothetical protein